jgi:hypothetical protein
MKWFGVKSRDMKGLVHLAGVRVGGHGLGVRVGGHGLGDHGQR